MHSSAKNGIGAVNLLTMDIIYAGLARIPAMGEEIATDSLTLALGGGPVASLVTAARLGVACRLATSFGDDHVSEIARGLLEQEPLQYKSFPADGDASPVNVTSVMTFENSDRAFISYFPKDGFYTKHTDAFYEYLHECEIVVASHPSVELLKRLHGDGCRVIYDVGWNDGLSLESLLPVLPYVYLFTPNEKEALKLTGAASPAQALAILAQHVPQPVVKLGAEGALIWVDGNAELVPPTDHISVDTTGAGDAFLGGVAYGLSQGWGIRRCVQLGNYTGGVATTSIGCITAHSCLEEFERMYPL